MGETQPGAEPPDSRPPGAEPPDADASGEVVSLKGKLLIASPSLMDPNFHRTVILIAEHDAKGALGLVLNRETDLPLRRLWETITSKPMAASTDAAAFCGGPVQRNAVLVLHAFDDLAPSAEPVLPGVYLGSDVDLLGRLLDKAACQSDESDADQAVAGHSAPAHERPDHDVFRVFCGYAGWSAGQLDAEMEAGGWLLCDANAPLVFRRDTATLWKAALASIGGMYELLAEMPPNPDWN